MSMFDSPWLRHPKVWILVGVLSWLLSIALAVLAYEPPTVIPDSTDLHIDVQAGASLRFALPVQRHLDRRCSVDVQRFISGPTYGAQRLGEPSHVSAETLRRREEAASNILSLSIRIPVDTVAGPTTITTENRYRCLWSPISWFWAIDDSWEVHFTTTAAKQGVVIVNP